MIDLKAPKRKKKKKLQEKIEQSAYDSLPIQTRFSTAREDRRRSERQKGASRAAHPHVQRERRKGRETNGRQPRKYYTNTRIKLRTYETKY
jgi:hypothetical protein